MHEGSKTRAMKIIFLHIGGFKTGTSAIQEYCDSSENELRKNDIYYPKAARPSGNPTNHGLFSISLCEKYGIGTPAWYTDKTSFEEVATHLAEEISNCKAKFVLISSEEFCRLANSERGSEAIREIKALFCDYNLKVIYYIRDSLEFLSSWYRQVNRGPVPPLRFLDFCDKLTTSFLDQSKIYNLFAEILGAANIELRKYDKHGQLIPPFLRAINPNYSFDLLSRVLRTNKSVNESIPEQEVETIRREKVNTLMPPSVRQLFFTTHLANDALQLSEFCNRVHVASGNQVNAFKEYAFTPYNVFDLIRVEQRLNGLGRGAVHHSLYYHSVAEALMKVDASRAYYLFLQSLMHDPTSPRLWERIMELFH